MQSSAFSQKYQASAFIIFSFMVHLFALLFVMAFPQLWLWALGTIILNHLLIVISGLLPRSHLLGKNWTRLPADAIQRGEVALTIDDGPDPEVTPRVLDILDEYDAKATFFCIGTQAEAYPDLCREIVRRGHAVENHTQHHDHYFSLYLNRHKIRAEIETAQQTFTQITGTTPLFFRPTAGLRNFLLDPVLFGLGLQLVSWTRRGFDTRNANPASVLNKLLHNLKAGDILLMHDGHSARTASGVPVVLEILPAFLEEVKARNMRLVTLKSALPKPEV